jgi:putative transposase
MPRKARIVVPGVAHHVVQRGHNRKVVFAADEDFQFYLDNLAELKGELDVRFYAYCLMTNHVHLLLMPVDAEFEQLAVRVFGPLLQGLKEGIHADYT